MTTMQDQLDLPDDLQLDDGPLDLDGLDLDTLEDLDFAGALTPAQAQVLDSLQDDAFAGLPPDAAITDAMDGGTVVVPSEPLADRLARQSADLQAAVFHGDGPADAVVAEVTADPVPPAPDAVQPVIGQTVLFGDLEQQRIAASRDLTTRFGVPPFSVLRADAGYWQERKAGWLALGIQSELGRGTTTDADAAYSGSGSDPVSQAMRKTGSRRKDADARSNLTGAAKLPDYADNGTELIAPGTSIFDPVLCELIYRWWLPTQRDPDRPPLVLDPFAGGSVRGIVAGMVGAKYIGVDLSRQQVEANAIQADAIMGITHPLKPVWLHGDSRAIADHTQHTLASYADDGLVDLVFSCPPYFDLEVYSDDPADLSRADSYDAFLQAYSDIISASLQLLREDRFAVWVIGEVRDKAGMQRGLVADTTRIFQTHGVSLYNEAVLITPVGTLALRAPKAMNATRKLARGHQAVLVFWKGRKQPAGWGDVL